jgi:hypothetical protein
VGAEQEERQHPHPPIQNTTLKGRWGLPAEGHAAAELATAPRATQANNATQQPQPPPTSAPLMVVHPALSSPDTPSAVKALLMTSPQKGATSSDQSAVLMSAAQQERRSTWRRQQRGTSFNAACRTHRPSLQRQQRTPAAAWTAAAAAAAAAGAGAAAAAGAAGPRRFTRDALLPEQPLVVGDGAPSRQVVGLKGGEWVGGKKTVKHVVLACGVF